METHIIEGDDSQTENGLFPEAVFYKRSGPAVFGYLWKDGCLILNENEAAIRRLIYDFFLKTKRKKTTATMLNNLGYRTRSGKPFSHTSVSRLLKDGTAKGIYSIGHNENTLTGAFKKE